MWSVGFTKTSTSLTQWRMLCDFIPKASAWAVPQTVTQYSQPSSRLRLSSVMMSMIKMHIRDINAVCDFILEASDWAASLALLPEEQRSDRPLFGLPVIFIMENMIIVVRISCRSWLKTVRLGVSNQLTSRKNITLSISSPGFCEGVFSRERLRRHHWSCPGSLNRTRTQINDTFLFQNRVKVKVVGEVSEKWK